jgi:hypothetical protein
MKTQELRQIIREEIQAELFGMDNPKVNTSTIERSAKIIDKGLDIIIKNPGGDAAAVAKKLKSEIRNILNNLSE